MDHELPCSEDFSGLHSECSLQGSPAHVPWVTLGVGSLFLLQHEGKQGSNSQGDVAGALSDTQLADRGRFSVFHSHLTIAAISHLNVIDGN